MINIIKNIASIPDDSLKMDSSQAERKLVLKFDKTKLKKTKLKNNFYKIFKQKLEIKYAEVIGSFGKILLLGLVDFNRAFTDPGVRTLETQLVNGAGDSSFGKEGQTKGSKTIVVAILRELVENVINESKTNGKKKRSISDIFNVGKDEFVDLTRSESGGRIDDSNNIVDLTRNDSSSSRGKY